MMVVMATLPAKGTPYWLRYGGIHDPPCVQPHSKSGRIGGGSSGSSSRNTAVWGERVKTNAPARKARGESEVPQSREQVSDGLSCIASTFL
jgi:hypothetical protein